MGRERRNGWIVVAVAAALAGCGAILMFRGVPASMACAVADGLTLACLLLGLLGLARLLDLASPDPAEGRPGKGPGGPPT